MARPVKNNADYFTHDSDMRNDPKIKAMRRKFGHEGFSVWIMILETLTDSENFEMEYNDVNIELMAGDFDIEPDLLRSIVEYCQVIKLVTVDDGFLYSKRHKERFSALINKRKRDRKRVFAGENTQSRVEYSRVKKSIEEKSINNKNTINFLDLENTQWFESVLSFLSGKISMQELRDYWKQYQLAMIADDDLYRDAKDYRAHFRNWVKIQVEKAANTQTGLVKRFKVFADEET